MKLKNIPVLLVLMTTFLLPACNSGTTTNPIPSASVTPAPGAITFKATLTGTDESPAVNTSATGSATLVLNPNSTGLLTLSFQGLSSDETGAFIHGPAAKGVNADIQLPVDLGQVTNKSITLTTEQITYLKAGTLYINIHTKNNPNGEIRGQLLM